MEAAFALLGDLSRIEPIDDDAHQLEILRRTAGVLERENATPWTLEQAPAGRVELLLPMIRSFRLAIESIEGVTKLSQRQPAPDRLRVIQHLLDRGDGDSTEIARLMAHLQPTHSTDNRDQPSPAVRISRPFG